MERSQSTRQKPCQMVKLCEGPMFPWGMMGKKIYIYINCWSRIILQKLMYAKVGEIFSLWWKQNDDFCVYTNLSLSWVMSQSWIITVNRLGQIWIRCPPNCFCIQHQNIPGVFSLFVFIFTASRSSFIRCSVFL